MKWHDVVVHKNVFRDHEACDNAELTDRTVARWVKAFRKGRDAVLDNLHTEQPHMENNTVQLLASLLDADCQWTVRELAAGHKTVLHILHDILNYSKLVSCWIAHEISKVQQWQH